MFESLGSKGPKLVYSHPREGVPSGDTFSDTPTTFNHAHPTFAQSRAIPRPSVTVVAQTRQPDKGENSEQTFQEETRTSRPETPGILTVVTKTCGGESLGESGPHFPQPGYGQTEIYHTFSSVSPHQHAVNGGAHSPEFEDTTSPAKTNISPKGISIPIERVPSLDRNNNPDSSGAAPSYSSNTAASLLASGSRAPSESSFSGSGYPEGYRVYRGKVYEMAREIPILVMPRSGHNGHGPARQSSPASSRTNTSSVSAKPPHSSSATASVVKVAPAGDRQSPVTHAPYPERHQLQQQHPRALPPPKLNGITPNGVSWSSVQGEPEAYDKAFDQLPLQQQALFREHRRPTDDPRVPDSAGNVTYTGGTQSLRRANTVSGKRNVRELSPQNWVVRGRFGSASSPAPITHVTTASRRLSPQRSAGGYRTLPFRETGGQVWTVVTKSPPGSPRQRSSSNTKQQGTPRASYRLDPNISTKLQDSNAPPKSILKTSSSPLTTSSERSDRSEYDNTSPLFGHLSPGTASDQYYTLPRPRATLAYRDFDFSGLPQQHHTQQQQQPIHPSSMGKKSLQQTNSLPIYHHKGKAQTVASPSHPTPGMGGAGRRPATAGAALQKHGETWGKGSLPQKKSVTFNSQVRLHVDNNVSTLRSLSIDS